MVRRLLVLLPLLLAGAVLADERRGDDASKALTEIARVEPQDASSDDCKVKVNVDFAAYTNKLQTFREAFLNKDFSVDFYNQRRKQVFSFVILKRVAELVTEGLYNGQSQPECSFTITVLYRNEFGQGRNFEALTWKFDSKQAGKINWENFDPRDFDKIALDYHLSQHITEWISDEPSMAAGQHLPPQADCDMFLFNANAIFIRATSLCRKDYMDTKEGLAALAGARQCASMPESEMKQKAGAAMLTLDRIARERGRAAVCPFVDQVLRQVRSRTQ